jgi:hypothetical protein
VTPDWKDDGGDRPDSTDPVPGTVFKCSYGLNSSNDACIRFLKKNPTTGATESGTTSPVLLYYFSENEDDPGWCVTRSGSVYRLGKRLKGEEWQKVYAAYRLAKYGPEEDE